MKLLLSPHNDDETLFAALTVMRERPIVVFVFDCYAQEHRTPSVTSEQRRAESLAACCEIFMVPVLFLGLRDVAATLDDVCASLRSLRGFGEVYAPARQGGHPHHDMVAEAARAIFGDQVRSYCTYSQARPGYAEEGTTCLIATDAEWEAKQKTMSCYRSQHVWSRVHFEAVGRREWLS